MINVTARIFVDSDREIAIRTYQSRLHENSLIIVRGFSVIFSKRLCIFIISVITVAHSINARKKIIFFVQEKNIAARKEKKKNRPMREKPSRFIGLFRENLRISKIHIGNISARLPSVNTPGKASRLSISEELEFFFFVLYIYCLSLPPNHITW